MAPRPSLPVLAEPLRLEPWRVPALVELTELAGQAVIRSDHRIPSDHKRSYTDGTGILDAFVQLDAAARGRVETFVRRFGPLYLDRGGFPLSSWRPGRPTEGDLIAGIYGYARAAAAAARIGVWLRTVAGGPPWDDVAILERVVLDYNDRFKDEAFGGGYSPRRRLPSAEELLSEREGPIRRKGDTERLSVLRSNLDRLDAGQTLETTQSTLRMFLDWWLGLRRIGPFLGSGGGSRLVFLGGAWQAIGIRLAEQIAGCQLDDLQWCAWGKHYYPRGRGRRLRSGLLACCGRAHCRKARSRAQTADSRARRNAQRESVP